MAKSDRKFSLGERGLFFDCEDELERAMNLARAKVEEDERAAQKPKVASGKLRAASGSARAMRR